MHVLRQYVEKIEGLTSFVEAAARNPVTQGVVLDVNPIWFAAYRLARMGLDPRVLDMSLYSFPSFLIGDPSIWETIEGDAIDFTWTDKDKWVKTWIHRLLNDYERAIPTSALPFIVKAIARPVGPDLQESRAQLVTLAASQNFVAIVETRPLGRLAVSAGDPCLAGGVPGTIGGFLRDQSTGAIYAATCGHVASKGAKVMVSGKHAGVCSHSHAPLPLAPGQFCTRACPAATRLDIALIDMGGAAVANTVTGMASQIACWQSIVLRGGMTGVQTYEVGGHVVAYLPRNSNVCFENLFEVRPRSSGGILNTRVRTLLAPVPTQGDSGGWVETTPSSEWCGVLVAADGLMGYALEADDTIIEANLAFGVQLQLA